ncbi:glucose-6-phosphate dehydrogenase [Paraliomyxa miuraensis]|uniref:glucose-6-phosphate dehydrogenase n=1 Tax=Paraliomyxa miuraensis TaxID=376150 RepID=UPI002256B0D4|nr:glucose-6-phosphate dehydrogenase [Paraliomyxa miuraensis]MCX4242021.1 glucose-6-phosphate dehydrogenase [Paraliomyxa miuraensis]
MSRPIQIVILGASGDLTSRKLVPALLRNFAEGSFPHPVQVVGVSRTDKTSEAWRTELSEWVAPSLRDAWEQLAPSLHWLRADAATPEGITTLRRALGELIEGVPEGCRERSGRLFYLALAPALFGPVVAALAAAGLLTCEPGDGDGWRRVVIEKPFGTDLPSATALNRALLTHLREDQIFRIDHYLGKETVQNILTLRFQNAIFEPLWNRKHIESVEISVCETVAMEGRRGAYYDTAGALRDMVQNHLLQILALTAMEPPGSLHADAIRNEKVKVLQSLRPLTPQRVGHDVVRGQYDGYGSAFGVAPGSTTETFVGIRALVDNWRWSGVPFLLRTGKAMRSRFTEVVLRFRTPPIDLLNGPTPENVCPLRPNDLRLQIQPNEGLKLGFLVKQPGPGLVMRHAELGFDYHQLVGEGATPDAYQRLLLDALQGQATLFIRGDEVEAAWGFVDGIREGWAQADPPLHGYAAGSDGPEAAGELFRGCEGTWSRGP